MIPTDKDQNIKLILTCQNSGNFERFMISDSSFSISSQNEKLEKEDTAIPAWIKNNAGRWANGQIDDGSFVEGIQFWVREGFMSMSDQVKFLKIDFKPQIDL